jgi:large subunit ribosomal protein L22
MPSTATISNYRQSPRKVRSVADLVRGKKVSAAMAELRFLPKRAGMPISKLIASAVASAKNADANASEDSLYITEIRVDKGVTMKRIMPRARGSASRINKRSSHLRVTIDSTPLWPVKIKKAKKAASKAVAAKTS